MIKVLLVNPESPDSFWKFRRAVKMTGRRVSMPPLSLLTLAAMLPREHFELRLVDLNAGLLTDELVRWADLVMVTGWIVQSESLRQTISQVKSFDKMVIVGGPYATAYPELVLGMGADCLVVGEAELTLALFIEDWLSHKGLAQVYDGSSEAARACSGVALTREGKPEITGTPIPRWDLLNMRHYSVMPVQFSRGCPNRCKFCDIIKLFGRKPRTKEVTQFIAELDALLVAGWRGSVFIVDDNFIGNRKVLRELLLAIIDWQERHGYPFSFFTEADINLAEMPEILALVVKAGFDAVFVGIESVNLQVLEEAHKTQNLGEFSLAERVKVLQATGLEVMGGFIIGNDSDRPDVCNQLFEFIQEAGIVFAMVGPLAALNGTELYNELKAAGRLRAEASGSNTHQLGFNFELKPPLDEKALIADYVRMQEKLFSPRYYFSRCRTLRARRGPHRRMKRSDLGSLLAVVRVCCRNLFHFDWLFWKFIVSTLCFSPRDFPEAITQAVKAVDFQALTDSLLAAHRYPEHMATLAERFEKRLAGLRGDCNKRLRKLAKLRQKIDTEATRRWLAIDQRFREGTKGALVRFRQYLDECAEKSSQAWMDNRTSTQ